MRGWVTSLNQGPPWPLVHFSEYREKPSRITLYRFSMAEANQLIFEKYPEDLLKRLQSLPG